MSEFLRMQEISAEGNFENAGGLKKFFAKRKAARAKRLTKRAAKLNKASEKVLGKKEVAPVKEVNPTKDTTPVQTEPTSSKKPLIIGGIILLVAGIVGFIILKRKK